jgi:hypothetical protein
MEPEIQLQKLKKIPEHLSQIPFQGLENSDSFIDHASENH